MKTFTIFLFAAVFAFVVQSCSACGTHYDVYLMRSLELKNMIHKAEDGLDQFDTLFETNVIQLLNNSRFCFQLSFLDTQIRSYTNVSQNIVGQSAIACDPSFIPELNSNIKDISLKTVYDFDENHESGEDVKDLFNVKYFHRYDQRSEDLLSASNEQVYDYIMENLGGRSFYNEARLVFYLNSPPEMTDTVSVVLKIEFEDGSTVQARTEDVIIK